MLSHHEFDELAAERGSGLVSIYMPTHRYGQAVREDPIRLKNLVSDAIRIADQAGLDVNRVERTLRPAEELIENTPFWQHQGDGLAILASQERFDVRRLNTSVAELAYVGERYCLRPMLRERSEGRHFYILALSQNCVRLLECTQEGAREMDLHDVPKKLEEAIGYDWEERSLQFHSASATVKAGRGAAVFHGQGAGSDESKDEIARYLKSVDEGIARILQDHRAPLVVAAVDYLSSMYATVSKYPLLVEDELEGNPERSSGAELQERALPLMQPYLDAARRKSVERFHQAAYSEKALRGIDEVLPAVRHGRVETLLIRSESPLWGRFDPDSDSVVTHHAWLQGDDDLLDLAVSYACSTGAQAVAANEDEMPGGAVVAAILRY